MNTKKIAEVMATVLNAVQVRSQDVYSTDIREYDLVGIGSGVYHGKFHENLYNWVYSLPKQDGKKAFIFSTTGSKASGERAHEHFAAVLKERGFKVIGSFSCLGFDTALSPAGINRGRPNASDLKDAEEFARHLKMQK
jgi:flavodoxin